MDSSEKPAIAPRRQPRQARSIERVATIRRTAAELISRQGVDGTSMSALARASGMSLASLYRYFPNKTAIIHDIAQQHVEKLDRVLRERLEQLDFGKGLDDLIDVYAHFYRHEPGYKEIWSGVESMPELRELDRQELDMNAREVFRHSAHLLPQVPEKRRRLASLLVPRTCGSLLRLASTLPEEEAAPLIQELKVMIRAYLRALSEPD
ncbi:MAG: TetR/AcrR family transcriptional regulator [Oleiphilaceae bacterium]|nr:TetR/AcrR family transcriptional regulator [Oleiphilaceae bacterium]